MSNITKEEVSEFYSGNKVRARHHWIRDFLIAKCKERGLSLSRFSELMGEKRRKNFKKNGSISGSRVSRHSLIGGGRRHGPKTGQEPKLPFVLKALDIVGYEMRLHKIKHFKPKLERI